MNYCRRHYKVIAVFLKNSENDSKLTDRINCGIYPNIYFRILSLGLESVALAFHVSGLGFDTSGPVNIPDWMDWR